jgi:hypothetical protein
MPKQYIDGLRTKEEMEAFQKITLVDRQKFKTVSQSYNNDGITAALSLGASYFLIRWVMSLDNKPIIQKPVQPSVSQPQAKQTVVFNNNNRVEVKVRQDRTQQPRPSRSVDDSERMDSTGAWILKMMFGSDGLKRQHYKIEGVSQSGKTTFVEYLLSLISDEDPTTEKLLIDPKYRKAKPNWSFLPYCADIAKVPKALIDFVSEVEERQQSETDFADQFPKIFVIDEWDWIFTDHGKDALRNLRKLIKVGAELRCYVVLLGQSPLAKDTGLSTSDFDQMVRISIGKVAMKVLNNPAHFAFSNRDELLVKAEQLYTSGQRFALIQEHGVAPRLEIIPKIVKPNQSIPDDIDLEEDEIPNDKVIPINRRAV